MPKSNSNPNFPIIKLKEIADIRRFPEWDGAIIYIAVPYKDNPQLAVSYSQMMVKSLLEMGRLPFSPILHNHYFHEYHSCPTHLNYLKWDLSMLDKIIEGEDRIPSRKLLLSFPAFPGQWAEWEPLFGTMQDWRTSEGCYIEYNWCKDESHSTVAAINLPLLILNKEYGFYQDV